MKKKNWKYLTVILLMVGVTMMILSFSSVATTVPMERSVTSIPVGYSEMVELKNMGKISHLSTSFTGSLDQSQEKLTHGYYIGIIWPDGGCYCQTVKNERKQMNGFQLAVGKHGNPTEPLYIGVMSSKRDPTGDNYHILISLDVSDIPDDDVFYWKGADFPSKPLEGPLCFIVAISLDDPSDGNYWMWGAGDGDPYKPWLKDHWHWNDENWVATYGDNKDMCFQTFTGSGGNGEPPDISISASSQVIVAQVTGILSLLGAVVCGGKWLV